MPERCFIVKTRKQEAESVQELLLKIISFSLLQERKFFSVKEDIFLCKTSPLPEWAGQPRIKQIYKQHRSSIRGAQEGILPLWQTRHHHAATQGTPLPPQLLQAKRGQSNAGGGTDQLRDIKALHQSQGLTTACSHHTSVTWKEVPTMPTFLTVKQFSAVGRLGSSH